MSAERSWDQLVAANEHQEYGQAWLPDREDDHPRTLVGTVRGYDRGPTSEYTGEQPWICSVEDRTGKLWSVWLNRAVLVSEFERARPLPDEKIVVRYRGRAETASRAGAAPPHLYTVTVDRGQQLPGFLTRPGPDAGAEPTETEGLAYGQQRPPDAEVVEDEPKRGEASDDDLDIPF